MSWAAAIAAGGAIIGGVISNKGAKDAAKASSGGYDAAAAESGRQYDQTREDQKPWLVAGQSALTQMQALNNGDFSSFTQSPDYQFALTQGLQGLDRSAAARGGLYSGGHSADTMNYASGLASQNYGNYYNRLASMAGVGQTTASNLGQLGQSSANTIGQAAIGAGNARASGYINQANNWNNMLGGLTQAGGYMIGNRGG